MLVVEYFARQRKAHTYYTYHLRIFIHQANMVNNNKQYTNQIKSNRNNNDSTDKKRSKLSPYLDTRLAHNTLGKEKPKYSWQ